MNHYAGERKNPSAILCDLVPAVSRSLDIFSEGKNIILEYLARNYGLSIEDFERRPDEVRCALGEAFGNGAPVIERLIIRTSAELMGLPKEKAPSNWSDFVSVVTKPKIGGCW